MIGETLLHYRITEKLGEGGMGEVYRAVDTRLGRDVAIKIVSRRLAERSDLVARLRVEARALAAVDHSNVAAVYAFEEIDRLPGTSESTPLYFLVMQLAEGESLAGRIAQRPLGTEQAVAIAIQIAEALEAAHKRGIIHRDLKPGNVVIDASGNVKVLDFGLARVHETRYGANDPTMVVSDQSPISSEGIVIGTAGYMSPEQVRGEPADRTSDIWSFGCVLFEMLSGKRTFPGNSPSERFAKILEREPPWDDLPTTVPGALRILLERCLQRDPANRFQNIADVRLWLQELPRLEAPQSVPTTPVSRLGRVLPWAVAAISLCVALWAVLSDRPPSNRERVTHVSIDTKPLALGPHPRSSIVALSPDGEMLAYVSGDEEVGQIYIRFLASQDSFPIEGAEHAHTPFFSPDGKWLGFVSAGELRKVPIDGGAISSICKVEELHGAVWGRDGTIVYSDLSTGGIARVSADGGEPRVVYKPTPEDKEQGRAWALWPELLPDGKSVLFLLLDHAGVADEIALTDLETGETRMVLEGGGNPRYLSTDHLMYPENGSLMVIPFDPKRKEISGKSEVAIEGLLMGFPLDPPLAHYAISGDGTLVFVAGPSSAPRSQLVRTDRSGSMEPIGEPIDSILGPRFAPGGRRVALSGNVGDAIAQIWVHDLERGTFSRMTFEGQNWWPQWTPDGTDLVFTSLGRGDNVATLYRLPSDGSMPPKRLAGDEAGMQLTSFSPDGVTGILNRNERPDTGWDIVTLPLDQSSSTPVELLASRSDEFLAALSPDGRFLAYTSNESGRLEIYTRSYPDLARKWQISTGGGIEPLWSHDGNELFYRDETGRQLMVVDIETDPAFRPGRPRLLLEGNWVPSPWWGRNYDVAPDGRSFLMVQQQMTGTENSRVQIVLNWTGNLPKEK